MRAPLIDGLVIPVNPELFPFAGVRGSLFLRQVSYWHGISQYEHQGKTYFRKSDDEWEKELKVSKRSIARVRKVLIAAGIIDAVPLDPVFYQTKTTTLWYCLNRDVLDYEWGEFVKAGTDLHTKFIVKGDAKLAEPPCQTGDTPHAKLADPSYIRIKERINRDSCHSSGEEVTRASDSDQFELTMETDGVPPDQPAKATWQEVVRAYNEICDGPGYSRAMEKHFPSSDSMKQLNARMSDPDHHSIEFWETYFHRVNASDWLSGRNGRKQGKTSLRFLLTKQKFINVWEGMYDNRA